MCCAHLEEAVEKSVCEGREGNGNEKRARKKMRRVILSSQLFHPSRKWQVSKLG